ncbi:MAG: trypsin-like peptidase domain-containing protein [Armatimonadota bacterium]|nr:trypsin-like peptidase domain-containing protein [Armatimonadota bacterium]MDR7448389.1 trypsin-like peptidase domain-containing protein [Armatimonadota bacterium]MDR7480313.1 trypsin-like peptidase domain-containing protein [Armatimonadota bacterium]MDR7502146.1 trypsin-like peptidase domain-containing protein [Armatimonadota bacterium]MDR7528008.1 trypsin-like peptidase domain-containing protein [Armatimonadota bacterium]
MRPLALASCLLALLVASLASGPAEAQSPYVAVIERVKPAVVIVEAPSSLGSGFYVSGGCHLATAAHVVGRARQVTVHGQGPSYPGTVVGFDRTRDVALVQGRPPCVALDLADSDRLQQGEEILVIGYPALLGAQVREPSVTRGIISATRGREGFIQYDAATFGGGSGSPVVNLRAEVVGVHVGRLHGGSGFSFAAPSNWVRAQVQNPTVVRSAPAFDDLVVPGERISGIALGMTLNEASAAAITTFGGTASIAEDCTSPEERTRGTSCRIRAWRGAGDAFAAWMILVGPPGQETVALIASTLSRHRTEEGLRRGMRLAEFVRVLGEPRIGPRVQGSRTFASARDGSPAAYWPREGIGVFFDPRTEVVWALVVFE